MLIRFRGTCARCAKVELSEDGETIVGARLVGGCPGNGEAMCRLLMGVRVERAISALEGIRCGTKGTSCPDQLAQGLKEHIMRKKENENA